MADATSTPAPQGATGVLVLADGTVIRGRGFGAEGHAVGEVCFNTAMTGYQEIMTDPSYARQIVTFTFPHIGNVGANYEDIEADNPHALGCVIRQDVTEPSSFRATQGFVEWMRSNGRIGLSGIDTRALTRLIREKGAPNGVIAYSEAGEFDLPALIAEARDWPGLEGMDLAKEVTTRQTHPWHGGLWHLGTGYEEGPGSASGRRPSILRLRSGEPSLGTSEVGEGRDGAEQKSSLVLSGARSAQSKGADTEEGQDIRPHVVAIDYGAKRNIFRNLEAAGARVTVLPATATFEEVMAHAPDGFFLSNGPGDPAATGEYALPVIRKMLETGKPLFGICLGHQLLGLAVGARTIKMHQGHRGANHPVKRIADGRVEITAMNHGFAIERESLPANARETHVSLFDGSNCGIELTDRPAFSVQYHPEASPGPQDSVYLFGKFVGRLK